MTVSRSNQKQSQENSFIEKTYRTGRWLTNPLGLGFEKGAKHIVRAYKGTGNRPSELAQGIFFTAIGLLPAITGQLIKTVVKPFRREMVVICPEGPPSSFDGVSSPTESMEGVTINAAALPSFIVAANKLSDTPIRVKALSEYIRDNENAEIICLQELFDEEAIAILIETLKDKYPCIIANVGNNTVNKLNSGLCIISKFHLANPTFEPFKEPLIGADARSNKGILGATVILKDGRKLTLITTHLQAGSRQERIELKEKELEQINVFCNARDEEHANDPSYLGTLITGDFNLSPYQDKLVQKGNEKVLGKNEYWTNAGKIDKFFHEQNIQIQLPAPDQKGITPDGEACGTALGDTITGDIDPSKKRTRKYNIIDHILLHKPTTQKVQNRMEAVGCAKVDPKFNWSDHMAVRVKVKFL